MPPPFAKRHFAAGHRPSPVDNQTSKSLRCNSTDGLERLYRREAPRLTAFFERRLKERQDASDFVQESFARFARLSMLDRLAQPAAYLQRIASNLLAEHGRRKRSAPQFDWDPDASARVAIPADQSFTLEADQLLAAYHQAVDELPAKTREVFLLHRIDDLPYRVIADRLGISIPTVQYHVGRALAHIDAALRA